MKLAILVNTDKHLEAVTGLTKAALAKGHEVLIFTMDDGTKLLANPSYTTLCNLEKVTMSFCDHNAKGQGVKTDALSDKIVCGSQYNNATMNHEADKVIVL